MEPVEYIGPSGAAQLVADPATVYRLQAAGWRPRSELETLAANSDPVATEHLQRAEAFRHLQEKQQSEREAQYGMGSRPQPQLADRQKPQPRPRSQE